MPGHHIAHSMLWQLKHELSSMNPYRLAADAAHALAWVVLLVILCCSRTASGLSLRTQELYLLVFAMRYADLAWNFYSLYNWYTKATYCVLEVSIVLALHCVPALRRTRSRADMRYLTAALLLVLPALVLGYFFNRDGDSPFEIAWAASLYLEAVAAVPQLVLTIREKRCRSAVSHYIFLLASYRALYGANWVYRYHHEYSYWQPEVWAAGAVQVRRSSRTTPSPLTDQHQHQHHQHQHQHRPRHHSKPPPPSRRVADRALPPVLAAVLLG